MVSKKIENLSEDVPLNQLLFHSRRVCLRNFVFFFSLLTMRKGPTSVFKGKGKRSE